MSEINSFAIVKAKRFLSGIARASAPKHNETCTIDEVNTPRLALDVKKPDAGRCAEVNLS